MAFTNLARLAVIATVRLDASPPLGHRRISFAATNLAHLANFTLPLPMPPPDLQLQLWLPLQPQWSLP